MIDMKPVTSSQIGAVGYDAETNTLRIRFKSGSTYEYAGVPSDIYDDLLTAESFGRFFGANIKGKFEYERLPDEPKDGEPATA